jgi:putative peptide zinc metalloprotease protein
VEATIEPTEDVALFHGRSGKIRYSLTPQPLLRQWVRKLRQLLQQRYQI